MEKDIKYPQFRKYKNNQSYFKIYSKTEFDELKWESNKWVLYTFKTNILPDHNFIHDLTYDYQNFWDRIDEEEFISIEKLIK